MQPSQNIHNIDLALWIKCFLYASKTIVRQMEKLQRKNLKWMQSNSHFIDKEYNDCLRSVNLLPITNQFFFGSRSFKENFDRKTST